MPCNVAIPKEPNMLTFILWYREAIKSPIYTLDFRKGPPDQSIHFPGKDLTDRSYFEISEFPPTLKIKPVRVEDEGVYRCRIEYKRSRTITRSVKLVILGKFKFINYVWYCNKCNLNKLKICFAYYCRCPINRL